MNRRVVGLFVSGLEGRDGRWSTDGEVLKYCGEVLVKRGDDGKVVYARPESQKARLAYYEIKLYLQETLGYG